MPVDGQVAVEIEEFGGLNTLRDSSNLPPYMSPACYNVEFIPRTVRSRYGFTTVLRGSDLANSINYVKSYIMPNGDIRTLFYDNVGGFWYEDATSDPDDQTQITGNFLDNAFPNSVTMFGKEFIAFGDGQQGYDIPRKYDGTTMSRISQDGPGAAPFVEEEAVYNIVAAVTGVLLTVPAPVSQFGPGGAFSSISQSGDLVTVVLNNTDFAFFNGESVTVAGVVPADYNGTFEVQWIPNPRPNLSLGFTTPLAFTYRLPVSGLPVGTIGTAVSNAAAFALDLPTFRFAADLEAAYLNRFSAGLSITVAGVGVGGYNGTWNTIGMMRWSETSGGFTYYGPALVANIASTGLANSTGGTVTVNGHIDAGTHEAAVIFETNDGYLTRPSPVANWTSTGKRITLSNIPTGPSNVIRRYVIFTPVSSEDFSYIPIADADPLNGIYSTVIDDNTTTTATFDFSDTDLLNLGVDANDLFDLITLPPVNGFVEYKSRLVAIGALNLVNGFLNLSFDGGFTPGLPFPLGAGIPLGWTPDPGIEGGGTSKNQDDALAGDCLAVIGTGISINAGKMTQSAYQDSLGNFILQPGEAYTVAAYFNKFAPLPGVTYTIRLSSDSEGFSTEAVMDIENDVTEGQWTRLTGDLDALPTPLPSDLTLTVFSSNNPIGDLLLVDEIGFYPTNHPVQNTLAMVSYPEDPESFNGLTGLLQPAEENGQALTSAFVLRDFLYLVKERSLFVTQDNGSEPSGDDPWQIDEVSQRVGTLSFRGVTVGDEWALIASETGFWYFTGGIITEDSKLSNEIEPTWDRTNWEFGWMVDAKVDTKRKRAYIALPLDNAEQPSHIAVLDYTQGFGDATDNNGVGRKWTLWNVGINSHNMVVRPEKDLAYYIGVNTGNQIKKHDTSVRNDDGDAIDNLWQSGYAELPERSNWGYLAANVQGAGTLSLTLKRATQWVRQIRGWVMNSRGFFDMERMIQAQGNRLSVSFGTNDPDMYWDLQGVRLYTTEAIFAPVRGTNQT